MLMSERLRDWSKRYKVTFRVRRDRVEVVGWRKLPVEVRATLTEFSDHVDAYLLDGTDVRMPGPLIEEISPGQFRCSIPRGYVGRSPRLMTEAIVRRRVYDEWLSQQPRPRTRFDEEVLGKSRYEGRRRTPISKRRKSNA